MDWEFVVDAKNHNYKEIKNYYDDEYVTKQFGDKFYCMWMAARATVEYCKTITSHTNIQAGILEYIKVIEAYPEYVEPIYELCHLLPSPSERQALYRKCIKCKGVNHPHSDPEILEWKALAGFLVECYNLEKYSDAYDSWVELQKTHVLDKVDAKYCTWIEHVKKCGNDSFNKLHKSSTFARFRSELENVSCRAGNICDVLIKQNGTVSKNKSKESFDIHFVWVQGHRTYSIIQYLTVRAAYELESSQNNTCIYIYNDVEPTNNEYWELTKKYATIVHITPPLHINGKDVPYAQHVADIMRVCIVYQLGGIYLDFDLLLIKSLQSLKRVLETDKNVSQNRTVLLCKETNDKIWNGFIMAKPYNTFLGRWLREYQTKYGDPSGGCWWAGLSVETPMRLYKTDDTDVTLLDTHVFLPFGFYDDHIYNDVCDEVYAVGSVYPNSYGVHLWETEAEKRGVLPKNKEWFDNHPDTIFAKLFGKYI